jgi:ABC-type multidrug transport system fused ATPase/permease subunit
LAIVGPTGSGKSTIVNLILRLYEPDLGEILIDGQNIKMHTVKSIRERIGVVPQDVSLFSGSIAENIAYGNPSISMREIEDAAKASGCDEFVSKLSDGYLTQIGEYGVRLSGGQRQRIAIARALITKPAILILDEATSNIDQESERLIRSAISKIMRRQTTIIISHRLSGVVDVDRICVLDRGKIVECGKHSELMERGGLYKRLYEAG